MNPTPETIQQLDHYLAVAKSAVSSAWSKLLRDSENSGRAIHQSLEHDLKLEADTFLEKELISHLCGATGLGALGEEGGVFPSKVESPFQWVIDPLDGTVNYARGIPLYCISVALTQDGVPVLGVIYDIPRGILYSGHIYGGAFQGDLRVSVSTTNSKSESILLTGFPVSMKIEGIDHASYFKQIQEFKKVRMLGSAAISLTLVLSGKADVYREERVKIWDVAAGLALVQAAGGVFSLTSTETPFAYNVIASNGKFTLT
jgi:myo-inositol-1(or 4)-monophosphatase